MSIEFNLLELHSPDDIHPRTWICIKGKKLETILKSLEKEVLLLHKLTRESLSREISSTLGCALGVVKQTLHGRGGTYAIPIVLELLKKSRYKNKFLKEIKKNIEFLKVNSASSKPIRAVTTLTPTLAKILGAFMADGSLSVQLIIASSDKKELLKVIPTLDKLICKYSIGASIARKQHYIAVQINKTNLDIVEKLKKFESLFLQHHYAIELTEEYKDNVDAFNRWLYEFFSIEPTSFYKQNNAWRTIFSNKILARYLINFFDVIPGPKSYTAHEPISIKKSSLHIRRSFAQGVLMFDGCVTKAGKMSLCIKSRLLYESIKEIWTKDNINSGGGTNKRNEWHITTIEKNNKDKFYKYFEKNTQKNKLLKWIAGDTDSTPIINQNSSHLSTVKLLDTLKEVKSCDISFLEKTFNRRQVTITYYLRILKNQGKIRISNTPREIANNITVTTSVLLKRDTHMLVFKKIREKFITDKNLSNILQIKKGTFSAWRKRKNRIPLLTLKEICSLIELDFALIKNQIDNTDRKIVELV